MKSLLVFSAFIFVTVMVGASFVIPSGVDLVSLYQSRLQVPLFTGFLTIGGFLLSLKTFILIKLREDLYDLPIYEERLEKQRLIQADLQKYAPLRRLGEFLVYSVAGALLTAVLQLTIGFLSFRVAVAFCLASAATTMVLVMFAWWQIKQNLNDWFVLLEQHYDKERKNGKT